MPPKHIYCNCSGPHSANNTFITSASHCHTFIFIQKLQHVQFWTLHSAIFQLIVWNCWSPHTDCGACTTVSLAVFHWSGGGSLSLSVTRTAGPAGPLVFQWCDTVWVLWCSPERLQWEINSPPGDFLSFYVPLVSSLALFFFFLSLFFRPFQWHKHQTHLLEIRIGCGMT